MPIVIAKLGFGQAFFGLAIQQAIGFFTRYFQDTAET